jgi:serine phosphatase RsbU (regulator of sigma subunit)
MTRLEQSISTASQLPLSEMADSILAKARAFGKQADDQTLLLIRRRS